MEQTLRWAGLNLVLLLGAGFALAILGASRRELTIRKALAWLLYGSQETPTLPTLRPAAYGFQAAALPPGTGTTASCAVPARPGGPPQVSASRQTLLALGMVGAGAALGLLLWPLHQLAAVLAGLACSTTGLLWTRQLSGPREKREVAEDVLSLVAHLRQTLGRGTTLVESLRAFALEVEPDRALAHRVEGCLAAVEMGVDLHQAFEAWVARDDKHLQALGDLLREVQRSREPQATLDRLSRKIVNDLRLEMRLRVKRQALLSIVVTVTGLFPPLMLALLEPAAYRLAQSILFSVGGARLGGG
jgi:hypothetical protein